MRKIQFVNRNFYHVFNRGIEKRDIFMKKGDWRRFLVYMNELNDVEPIISMRQRVKSNKPDEEKERIIKFIAYCLNPNHFHLILEQTVDEGISNFMHKLGTAYTKYFNLKYDRSGSLFEGRFKAVHVDSNEYLLYLSVYVNLNYQIHGYGKSDGLKWKYSSCLDYFGERKGRMCDKEIVLSQFNNNMADYKCFALKNAEYIKDKRDFQKYLLEE